MTTLHWTDETQHQIPEQRIDWKRLAMLIGAGVFCLSVWCGFIELLRWWL